jgi:hypothetical protein
MTNEQLDTLAEIARDALQHADQEVAALNGTPDDYNKVRGLIEEIGYLSGQLMYIQHELIAAKTTSPIRKFALLCKS